MSESRLPVRKPNEPGPPGGRFVPTGVDAQSWIGFEQRIQERRFRALMDAIAAASARGDGVGARLALEEARELRPEAAELAEAEARVAALPLAGPAAAPGFFQSRTFGAVAMLGVGVALLTALDSVRPVETPAAEPPAAIADSLPAAVAVSTSAVREMPLFDPEPPVAAEPEPEVEEQDEIAEALDSVDRAIGTVGVTERSTPPPAAVAAPPLPAPPVRETLRERPAAAPERPAVQPAALVEAVPEPEPPLPRVELADDPILLPSPQPRREAIVASPALSREVRGSLLVRPLNVPADEDESSETAVSASMAAARDESLVSSVLDRYARAYDALDASAAREVWPTVDERALARAFAGLSSQHLTFDDCRIDVRGETANASCRGLASYVGKVGSRQPRTEPRRWTFELRRDGEAWKIASAETALVQ